MAADRVKSSYRDPIVWQRAVDLIPHVYKTLRDFPITDLGDQLASVGRPLAGLPDRLASAKAERTA